VRRFNLLAPEFDLSSEREGYRASGPPGKRFRLTDGDVGYWDGEI
jgi:hypothetical protein